MKFLNILFIVFFLQGCSCSDDSSLMSQLDVWDMIQEEDPNAKKIIPKDINSGIKCSDYGAGCVAGRTVLVDGVEMITVEFDSIYNARKTAEGIDQYYAQNWVFDDVTNEPRLVRFVRKVFNAKKARPDKK